MGSPGEESPFTISLLVEGCWIRLRTRSQFSSFLLEALSFRVRLFSTHSLYCQTHSLLTVVFRIVFPAGPTIYNGVFHLFQSCGHWLSLVIICFKSYYER